MAAAFSYGQLDPAEIAMYSNRRRAVTSQWGNQQAQIKFNRANTLGSKGRAFGDLARQYGQMRERLPGQFIQRGLQNSGLFKGGLQDYARQRAAATGDLTARFQELVGNQDLAWAQGADTYANQTLDINDQEQARRAQVAAALRGLQ